MSLTPLHGQAAADLNLSRTVVKAVSVTFLLLLIGTLGYHILEQWPLFDAFYMTVITLSTVGYGEVRPLSVPGRLLSIALILGGVGTLGYALGAGFSAGKGT